MTDKESNGYATIEPIKDSPIHNRRDIVLSIILLFTALFICLQVLVLVLS